MICVSANLYRAAHVCVSNGYMRPYLRGVCIEPHPVKGATLTAADGPRLVCIYNEEANVTETAIVRLHRKTIKFCEGNARYIIVEGKNANIVEFDIQDTHIVNDDNVVIDGTFPDWRAKTLVDQTWDTNSRPGAFDAKYLADFGKIAAMLCPMSTSSHCIRVLSANPHEAALVLFPRCENAFGLLMPMYYEGGEQLPEWFTDNGRKANAETVLCSAWYKAITGESM